MISKESKSLILQNLRSASTMEEGVRETTENSFVNPELSIDQSKLQNDFIVNFEMVSGEVHLLEEKGNLIEKIN